VCAAPNFDALIILGDDQKELFHEDHLPSILVYYGDTSATCRSRQFQRPRNGRGSPPRATTKKKYRETIRFQSDLALHLINSLIDSEFDIARSNGLPPGHGKPRSRLCAQTADGRPRPADRAGVLNTYYPAEPAHTTALLQASARRSAPRVESWPSDARIGIAGSGGLSHFCRR